MSFHAGAAVSANGYRMDEVVSALQKAIRRGEEQQALYWSREMLLSNYHGWLWKRLRVICSEDIGLAEPQLPTTIHALYCWFSELHKAKSGEATLPLTHAVLLLTRAKKSRLVCDACCTFELPQEAIEQFMGGKPVVPDHALDQHTSKGRSLKRSIKHFIEEGAQLANAQDEDNEFAQAWQSYWLTQPQATQLEIDSTTKE